MEQVTDILKSAARDARVTAIAGSLLGILTQLFPIEAAVVMVALIIGVFAVAVSDERKVRKHRRITDDEIKRLLHPDKEAARIARASNKNLLVVGQFVEIAPHPNLDTGTRLNNLGWKPDDSEDILIRENGTFDASLLMMEAGGVQEFDPPNGKKYSLVSPIDTHLTEESPRLQLVLKETDYFTISTAKDFLEKNPARAGEFGRIDPKENKIPSSLCLHFTVRTKEGSFLCMRRADSMAYHRGLWSITGEEQLSTADLEKQSPLKTLFERALCEEILYLRNENDVESMRKELFEDVEALRILSVGMELPLYNPCLVGMVQLKHSSEALRTTLIRRGESMFPNGAHDDEGKFYILEEDEALTLLAEGSACVSGLFSKEEVRLDAKRLHPTSRYRLFRILRNTRGKELQRIVDGRVKRQAA